MGLEQVDVNRSTATFCPVKLQNEAINKDLEFASSQILEKVLPDCWSFSLRRLGMGSVFTGQNR